MLKSLDSNKATGPDELGNKLLKLVSTEISPILTRIFNKSFTDGKFPEIWKIANVLPLYKKGEKNSVKNYRPISLLPCISKLLEKNVYNRIYTYLKRKNFIYKFQSGFQENDSTINQLTYDLDKIYQYIDRGSDLIGVFLDFSKAFDKVWHKGLLFKLKKAGTSGNLHKWLESYISNRKQRVIIDGMTSDYQYLSAGVPQGSVLGPLLFIIYINDIADNLQSQTCVYADDTALFVPTFKNANQAVQTLNEELQKILDWCNLWKVELHP